MKRLFIYLISLFAVKAQSQGSTIYDPYVGVVTLSPSSPYTNLPASSFPIPATTTINIGAKNEEGFEEMSWGEEKECTSDGCKLGISISATVGRSEITGLPLQNPATSSNWASKFDWTLLSVNTLVGFQKPGAAGAIPPGATGFIVVPIRHIQPSFANEPIGGTHPCSVPNANCTLGFTQGVNGIVVNLQPPSQPANDYPPFRIADDNMGAYVYGGVLPIKLSEFNVNKVGDFVLLDWKSEVETDFSHFEVEKSMDGENFVRIGVVNGNNVENAYSLLDKEPFSGINYYRLKMVDKDLTYVYSEIKAVDMGTINVSDVEIFPNPFTSGFTLRGLSKGAVIKVYDSAGTLIYNQTTNDPVFRADLLAARGGIYNVTVEQNGKVTRKNVIKVE